MFKVWLKSVHSFWVALWQGSPIVCISWAAFQIYALWLWSTKGYSMFADSVWQKVLSFAIIIFGINISLFLSAMHSHSVGGEK